MKISCLQPRILENRTQCYNQIKELIRNLKNEHSEIDFVVLPERWVPFDPNIENNFQQERGEDYEFIKSLAKDFNVNILSGAIWEKRNNPEKNVCITCYYFDDKGKEIGRQDKIHLYTYELKYFKPGNKLKLFKFDNFYFAILICFDMELIKNLEIFYN